MDPLENGSPPKRLNPPLTFDVDGSTELIPPKILANEESSGGDLAGEFDASSHVVENINPVGWVGI